MPFVQGKISYVEKKEVTASKLSSILSLKNICLKFHATKIYFPPICHGFKNEIFGT